MPDENPSRILLRPDGVRVAIPARDAELDGALTVEIRGIMRCAYNGAAYDAVYACDSNGDADLSRPHAYLGWQPYAPALVESDTREHRYVFRFPRIARGVSPAVRV